MSAVTDAERVLERTYARDAARQPAPAAPVDGPSACGDWLPWGLAVFCALVVVRAIVRGSRIT